MMATLVSRTWHQLWPEAKYFTAYKAPWLVAIDRSIYFPGYRECEITDPWNESLHALPHQEFQCLCVPRTLNTFNLSKGGFTKNNIPTINYLIPAYRYGWHLLELCELGKA